MRGTPLFQRIITKSATQTGASLHKMLGNSTLYEDDINLLFGKTTTPRMFCMMSILMSRKNWSTLDKIIVARGTAEPWKLVWWQYITSFMKNPVSQEYWWLVSSLQFRLMKCMIRVHKNHSLKCVLSEPCMGVCAHCDLFVWRLPEKTSGVFGGISSCVLRASDPGSYWLPEIWINYLLHKRNWIAVEPPKKSTHS